LIAAISLVFFNVELPLKLYGVYFITSFLLALISTKNGIAALFSILAIMIQFFGYGYGFLKSTVKLIFSNKDVEEQFPNLFFKIKR